MPTDTPERQTETEKTEETNTTVQETTTETEPVVDEDADDETPEKAVAGRRVSPAVDQK